MYYVLTIKSTFPDPFLQSSLCNGLNKQIYFRVAIGCRLFVLSHLLLVLILHRKTYVTLVTLNSYMLVASPGEYLRAVWWQYDIKMQRLLQSCLPKRYGGNFHGFN